MACARYQAGATTAGSAPCAKFTAQACAAALEVVSRPLTRRLYSVSVELPMAMGSSAVTTSSGRGGASSSPASTLSVGTVEDSAAALVEVQAAVVKTKLVDSATPKVGAVVSVPPRGGVSAYMRVARAVVAVRPAIVSLPLYWKPE